MTTTVPPAIHRRRADLLAPADLQALGGLELLARSVVEGFLMGLHRSPHRGFSAEFAELRGYRPGDDLRHIDWRMYARSDRFYVKQFEEETTLKAHLLLDTSRSMEWSSLPGELPTKLWYGKMLVAALTVLLVRQGDQAGLACFDETVREWLPARGGRRQLAEVIRRLEPLAAGGGTDPAPALKDAALRLRRRGLVVLISDLLVDPDEALRSLRFLRHRGHQVLVFHLIDPGERELPGAGEVVLQDPESDAELRVDATEMRASYHDAVERAILHWRRELRSSAIDYLLVETSSPPAGALRAFFAKRGRAG